MEREHLDMNEITEERRAALVRTITSIGTPELTALGEKIFPNLDHPWRTVFLDFVAQNAEAKFYHGTTHDGVHVVYCAEREKGIWFVPERGAGPLQAKGLGILKEITASV